MMKNYHLIISTPDGNAFDGEAAMLTVRGSEGDRQGYPLRTYSGGVFLNGYSDHFPTMIYLVKEIK